MTTLDHHPTDATTLSWTPPGPGSWAQMPDHYPRPVTASRYPIAEAWSESFTEWIGRLGLPITAARMVPVHGIPYVSFEFPGGGNHRLPPPWALKLLVKVVPSMRRSERQAARVLAERPWVAGVRAWYDLDRDAAIGRLRALTAIAPEDLDDAALAEHLIACGREELASAREHYDLHAHDEVPVLLYLVRMVDWGFERHEAFDLLAGSSPVSTGDSPELDGLRRAVAGRQAESIEELRALGPDVAEALDGFIARHGWRLADGYDVDCPCIAEVPELVVRLATAAPTPGPDDDCVARPGAAVEAARLRVPEADRVEFDRILVEARDAYGLRDDNGAILIAWPTGLVRRVMLEAGRRLVVRGDLSEPDLAVEATVDELASALVYDAVVRGDVLAERAAFRRAVRVTDAPMTLGPPEPPTPTNFPGAFGVMLRALDMSIEGAPSEVALRGIGIGDEAYEGRARLVMGAGRGLAEFEPGEVLVAPMTSPSYNIVLSLAGAVVTEAGDKMSHAAIMARELGLPAVIGAPQATTEIRDGDVVRVDPVTGTVEVRRDATMG